MGGGLLHGGISLPIQAGESSIEARRRLELPGSITFPLALVYDAVTDFLHMTGGGEADGWAASTGFHDSGHMLYGPYTSDWCGYKGVAQFSMMVDNNTADDLVLVKLDIFDATTGTVLAELDVTRSQFNTPFEFQTFSLGFDASYCTDHSLEARVYWTDNSFVKINTVQMILNNQ